MPDHDLLKDMNLFSESNTMPAIHRMTREGLNGCIYSDILYGDAFFLFVSLSIKGDTCTVDISKRKQC
jgi:hypothetical protein